MGDWRLEFGDLMVPVRRDEAFSAQKNVEKQQEKMPAFSQLRQSQRHASEQSLDHDLPMLLAIYKNDDGGLLGGLHETPNTPLPHALAVPRQT